MLSHFYGARIAADVAQRLVDETFPKAVTEQQLQPVTQPAIETRKLDGERALLATRRASRCCRRSPASSTRASEPTRPKISGQRRGRSTRSSKVVRKCPRHARAAGRARAAQANDVATIDLRDRGRRRSRGRRQRHRSPVSSSAPARSCREIDRPILGKSVGGYDAAPRRRCRPQHPHPKLRGQDGRLRDHASRTSKSACCPRSTTSSPRTSASSRPLDGAEGRRQRRSSRSKPRRRPTTARRAARRRAREGESDPRAPVAGPAADAHHRAGNPDRVRAAGSEGDQPRRRAACCRSSRTARSRCAPAC